MIVKVNDENFMHICRSCGKKRELTYNDSNVKLTSRSKVIAFAAIKCECGSMESFTSATLDENVLKVFCRLLLNEGQ